MPFILTSMKKYEVNALEGQLDPVICIPSAIASLACWKADIGETGYVVKHIREKQKLRKEPTYKSIHP
jgi:hypothetical protein